MNACLVNLRRWLGASLLCVLATGCAGRLQELAGRGDITSLRSELAGDPEVDVSEAQDIARQLMVHSIETAQGDSGRVGLNALRLHARTWACAEQFETSLRRRSDHGDELAAEAAMLRIESGQVRALSYAGRVTHEQPHWRAVGARSLVKKQQDETGSLADAGRWRRLLMADPSQQVRRAALKAAADARDPRDVGALLEAARLDPDPKARLSAIEALGRIATPEATYGLRDLWVGASEEIQVSVVGAWALTVKTLPLFATLACLRPDQNWACLARAQLSRVAEADEGMASLVAALAILDAVGSGLSGRARERPESQRASAVIERLIDKSPARIRVAAIDASPLSWAHLIEAIVDAQDAVDDAVAVAALGRLAAADSLAEPNNLLGSVKKREQRLERLRAFAKGSGPAAEAAKGALVAARDGQAVALLASDATAKSASQRAVAGQRYAALGAVGLAAKLLGDVDPKVRATTACAILTID